MSIELYWQEVTVSTPYLSANSNLAEGIVYKIIKTDDFYKPYRVIYPYTVEEDVAKLSYASLVEAQKEALASEVKKINEVLSKFTNYPIYK